MIQLFECDNMTERRCKKCNEILDDVDLELCQICRDEE